ncbi:MAG: transglycosylase SLT domain-containing protein [Woeseiaceae bacterium]
MKLESIWMTRVFLNIVLAVALSMGAAHAQETFPKPPELQPDVDFWVSVFTAYDSDEGVLHDNRNLAVVYGRLDISAQSSRRQRNRIVSNRRKELQAVLRTLAGGKRDNLTAEQERVLALWPDGVSNAELKAAVNRIRFQQGLSDRFRAGLARSGRWRDFIETEFSALGVPVELAALPHVESSYNPDARSHVGASGIWQFTRSTARRFMRVDHVIDERNDPFEATRGAGRLLAYNYSITRNWPMAITAYNHGLAGVRRAMRKFGDTAYVDIFRKYNGRTFGFASRNFYVAFLAAMEVDQNTDKYFPGVTRENARSYATASLRAYVPAADLSKALGMRPAQLARHNPALQATVWQGSKHLPRGFEVRVPASSINGSIDSLLARIPSSSWADKQLPDLFHTVVRGDTLSQIAETYRTRISTLVTLNSLGSRHRIRIGQRIRLPAAGPAPQPAQAAAAEAAVVVSTEPPVDADADVAEVTPSALAGGLGDTPTISLPTALLSDPSDYSVAANLTIEVQPLETLGHYADWLGIRTQRLRDINGLAFRTPVTVGRRIELEFSDIDRQTFESRRIASHRAQQDAFFREHVITGVTSHEIRRGESIWILSLREYDVPVWLFRQYNPALDLHNVQPGMTVRFPKLTTVNPS